MSLEPSDRHLTVSECGRMPLRAVHDSKRIHILESQKSMGMAQMPHSPAMPDVGKRALRFHVEAISGLKLKGASSKKADEQSEDILSTIMQETLEKN